METMRIASNGYAVEKVKVGNLETGFYWTVNLYWSKRGRKPAIINELSSIYKEENGNLKLFRSESDANSVMNLVKSYMEQYSNQNK